jgi:hypothetical protein
MGSEQFYPEERPVRRVWVDGFWMDEHPVTVAEFRRFVKATGYVTWAEIAPEAADYPGADPELLVPGSLVFQRTPGPVDLRAAALVEAMFMAELRNRVLTAGHDLDELELPLRADVSADGDRYVTLGGAEVTLSRGDMLMTDGAGIVSSVLRGPDQRTRITPGSRSALFAVYAPAGVGEAAVRRHLDSIRANVTLVAPEAQTAALVTLTGA